PYFLPGRRVPQAQRAVAAAGDNPLAVCQESDGADVGEVALVSAQHPDLLARGRVPQAHDAFVVGASSQGLAVAGEGQRTDGARVPLEVVAALAGGEVPEPNDVAAASRGGQELAVGRQLADGRPGLPRA